MDSPEKNDEKGQALAEFVLLAPLFVTLLWTAWQGAMILRERLELSALSRECVLYLSRADARGTASLKADLHLLARGTSLDTSRLEFDIQPLILGDTLPGGIQGPVGLASSILAGQRLTLEYAHPLKGLAGIVFGPDLKLRASVAFKAGPWKQPGLANLFHSR